MKHSIDPRLKDLADRLREKRGATGVRATAAEIGVSPATLSRVERGYLPDLDTFGKICRWLEVDPAPFLGISAGPASRPRASVHFRKQAAVTPAAAQALAEMVLAAYAAWIPPEE